MQIKLGLYVTDIDLKSTLKLLVQVELDWPLMITPLISSNLS